MFFFQLRQLAKTKPYLPRQHFETVIHAFVTTRLDYCNALYVGVSGFSVARLQMVQNAAAHLLTETRKYEHNSPILTSLHWLPVAFRIQFKIPTCIILNSGMLFSVLAVILILHVTLCILSIFVFLSLQCIKSVGFHAYALETVLHNSTFWHTIFNIL